MPVALLGHPDRRDAETEKAGVVSGQIGFDRRIIQEIIVPDFVQLDVSAPGRATPDRKHALNPGIEQAFAQYALPDHSGGAEQDDFHAASLHTGRNRLTAPMIAMTKNTNMMPWTTAKSGSLGGTLGASACSGPIFRKLWITSTKTLR